MARTRGTGRSIMRIDLLSFEPAFFISAQYLALGSPLKMFARGEAVEAQVRAVLVVVAAPRLNQIAVMAHGSQKGAR